jgi:hypothetical protein
MKKLVVATVELVDAFADQPIGGAEIGQFDQESERLMRIVVPRCDLDGLVARLEVLEFR